MRDDTTLPAKLKEILAAKADPRRFTEAMRNTRHPRYPAAPSLLEKCARLLTAMFIEHSHN